MENCLFDQGGQWTIGVQGVGIPHGGGGQGAQGLTSSGESVEHQERIAEKLLRGIGIPAGETAQEPAAPELIDPWQQTCPRPRLGLPPH